jgi:hypothetical protein
MISVPALAMLLLATAAAAQATTLMTVTPTTAAIVSGNVTFHLYGAAEHTSAFLLREQAAGLTPHYNCSNAPLVAGAKYRTPAEVVRPQGAVAFDLSRLHEGRYTVCFRNASHTAADLGHGSPRNYFRALPQQIVTVVVRAPVCAGGTLGVCQVSPLATDVNLHHNQTYQLFHALRGARVFLLRSETACDAPLDMSTNLRTATAAVQRDSKVTFKVRNLLNGLYRICLLNSSAATVPGHMKFLPLDQQIQMFGRWVAPNPVTHVVTPTTAAIVSGNVSFVVAGAPQHSSAFLLREQPTGLTGKYNCSNAPLVAGAKYRTPAEALRTGGAVTFDLSRLHEGRYHVCFRNASFMSAGLGHGAAGNFFHALPLQIVTVVVRARVCNGGTLGVCQVSPMSTEVNKNANQTYQLFHATRGARVFLLAMKKDGYSTACDAPLDLTLNPNLRTTTMAVQRDSKVTFRVQNLLNGLYHICLLNSSAATVPGHMKFLALDQHISMFGLPVPPPAITIVISPTTASSSDGNATFLLEGARHFSQAYLLLSPARGLTNAYNCSNPPPPGDVRQRTKVGSVRRDGYVQWDVSRLAPGPFVVCHRNASIPSGTLGFHALFQQVVTMVVRTPVCSGGVLGVCQVTPMKAAVAMSYNQTFQLFHALKGARVFLLSQYVNGHASACSQPDAVDSGYRSNIASVLRDSKVTLRINHLTKGFYKFCLLNASSTHPGPTGLAYKALSQIIELTGVDIPVVTIVVTPIMADIALKNASFVLRGAPTYTQAFLLRARGGGLTGAYNCSNPPSVAFVQERTHVETVRPRGAVQFGIARLAVGSYYVCYRNVTSNSKAGPGFAALVRQLVQLVETKTCTGGTFGVCQVTPLTVSANSASTGNQTFQILYARPGTRAFLMHAGVYNTSCAHPPALNGPYRTHTQRVQEKSTVTFYINGKAQGNWKFCFLNSTLATPPSHMVYKALPYSVTFAGPIDPSHSSVSCCAGPFNVGSPTYCTVTTVDTNGNPAGGFEDACRLKVCPLTDGLGQTVDHYDPPRYVGLGTFEFSFVGTGAGCGASAGVSMDGEVLGNKVNFFSLSAGAPVDMMATSTCHATPSGGSNCTVVQRDAYSNPVRQCKVHAGGLVRCMNLP